MAKQSVFEFQNYKTYLDKALESRAQGEKGQRFKLSQFIGCNAGYLSKILNEHYHLSLEQAFATNEFLGHTPNESKYFLNLVQLERAGTQALREYFREELRKQKAEHQKIENRISVGRILTEGDQARYYSSWHFAAIHVLVLMDTTLTKEQIANALQLPLKTVSETLEFLIEIGILKRKGRGFTGGETNLFLDKTSPFITKHHTNWKMKCIQSLDDVEPQDFHYSSVAACSSEDLDSIREVILRAVQEIRSIVGNTKKSDTLYCYSLDLFHLLKSK